MRRRFGIIHSVRTIKEQVHVSVIRFKTKLFKIHDWTLLRLPKDASAKLPSRGIAMIKGTINGSDLETALEPDGQGSHWFKVNKAMRQAAKAEAGDTVTLEIEPTKEWSEPEVPADIKHTLEAAPKAHTVWTSITPMARREWIRWIRATNRLETRQRRIEVACSKLKSGMRRPCCFNASMCTEPYVSKNGVLLEPAQTK